MVECFDSFALHKPARLLMKSGKKREFITLIVLPIVIRLRKLAMHEWFEGKQKTKGESEQLCRFVWLALWGK